jgi:hypothetical protein
MDAAENNPAQQPPVNGHSFIGQKLNQSVSKIYTGIPVIFGRSF